MKVVERESAHIAHKGTRIESHFDLYQTEKKKSCASTPQPKNPTALAALMKKVTEARRTLSANTGPRSPNISPDIKKASQTIEQMECR